MRSSADPGGQQLRRVLGRALRLRCPSCGQARAFKSWFTMTKRCEACNFWFEREDGYFIGATAVNMVLGIIIPAAVAFTVMGLTLPNTPWTLVAILFIGLALFVPIVCYPIARMVWLAVDLVVRPIQPAEYEHEHALEDR